VALAAGADLLVSEMIDIDATMGAMRRRAADMSLGDAAQQAASASRPPLSAPSCELNLIFGSSLLQIVPMG